MTRLHRAGSLFAILFVLLGGQSAAAECPAALNLRGVGKAVAKQVEPYAKCLNSTLGTPEEMRSSCRVSRDAASRSPSKAIDKAKLDEALTWLDAMTEQRAMCETRLLVEAS